MLTDLRRLERSTGIGEDGMFGEGNEHRGEGDVRV